MPPHPIDPAEAPARVLALMMAADGRADEREIESLVDDNAFRRLGVSRARFCAMARDYEATVGPEMRSHNYLHLSDIEQLDALMDGVRDARQRLLVCALAARVITADGRIRDIERLMFDHMLCRWGLTRSMVSRAILEERAAAL